MGEAWWGIDFFLFPLVFSFPQLYCNCMKVNKDIERLFRQYYLRMYHLAYSILYDKAEAKDAVSDVFTKLLEDKTVLLPDTEEGFLLRATRNRCLNIIAHKSVRERIGKEILTTRQLSDNGLTNSFMDELQSIIAGLEPPIRRQILQLHYLGGLTYEDIASNLKVSKVTVYNHLSKALDTIRKTIKGKGNGKDK